MRAWLLAAITLVLASSATGQGGYVTEKHPEHGLTFPRAKYFEAVPTQPTEEYVVLKYAEKKSRTKRRIESEMWVLRIDPVRAAPKTGLGGEVEGADAAEASSGTSSSPPITDFESFVGVRLDGWSLGEPLDTHEKGDWKATEYLLDRDKVSRIVCWALVWRKQDEREMAVLGLCHVDDFEDVAKIWRHSAKKMKLTEPSAVKVDRERVKWERHYARKRFIDPEHRIGVRLSLPKGWKAEDTENYIVVYDTPDEPLVRRILRDLELMRREYERLFPPVDPIEVVSTVRVCKSREEYGQYGGPHGTAGYWSSTTEELVFYDATKQRKNERKDRADTYVALYHEAFHQYIHYSAGELAPHPWFGEGYGDYFSGAVITNGRMRKIGPFEWRLAWIQLAVERHQHVPWRRIIRYEREDYYADPGTCYAQGWSMVYFLNTSKKVRKHPTWSRILPTYFDELKLAWRDELEKLAETDGEVSVEQIEEAQLAARTRAVDKAFSDVDLRAIEEEWSAFVEDL